MQMAEFLNSKYGLSHLVFCSITQNNFSYKQFLLFIKEDMDKIKEDNKLKKNFLFRQDNEVENQWKLF